MPRFEGLILLASLLLFLFPGAIWADQVFLTDGTVYRGRILTDTSGSLLLTDRPDNAPPVVIAKDKILRIVHDTMSPRPGDWYYALLSAGTGAMVFPRRDLDMNPATELVAKASARINRWIQIDGFVGWAPALEGKLAIAGPTDVRGYEHFYAYSGGTQLRFFPLARHLQWEPYVLGGYAWDNLIPKDSGDRLEGEGWRVGAGVSKRLSPRLLLDMEIVYDAARYTRIQFEGSRGSLSNSLDNPTCSLLFSLGWIL